MLPQSPLMLADALRRQAGRVSDLWGMGPVETAWRQVATFPGARLRAYREANSTGPTVLIIPAPFKRVYIWDLMPPVSVVRAALDVDARVFLLEWLPPTPSEPNFSLGDYALRLPEAAAREIARETGEERISLVGHSIGGTFAAIFATLRPELVHRLGLIDAPLAFGEVGGPIAEAVARAPHATHVTDLVGSPVAGSAIDLFSAGAVPEAFLVQRWSDMAASLSCHESLAIHLRVMRWSLDEFPLPGKLFEDIVEGLYRRDRFRGGTLPVGPEVATLDRLTAPVVAVVNPAGRVVPPESLFAGLRCARCRDQHVLQYEPDRGPALQHLGPLVSQSAHRELWPQIMERLTKS